MKTKYSPTGTDTPRHHQQLRHRLHALGHLPHRRGELGRLLHPRGDRRRRARRRHGKSVVSLNRYGRARAPPAATAGKPRGADDKYARWNISQTGASADGSDDYRNELNPSATWSRSIPTTRPRRSASARPWAASRTKARPSACRRGKPLAVYMGDDSRGEYIYKFVSTANWDAADANPANRITTGDKYLDSGKLYVAKFNADGTRPVDRADHRQRRDRRLRDLRFADQADMLVNARLAADAVGATKMDRPEWCAVQPGDRRDLLHADQQQQPQGRAERLVAAGAGRGQPARLHRHADGATAQPATSTATSSA